MSSIIMQTAWRVFILLIFFLFSPEVSAQHKTKVALFRYHGVVDGQKTHVKFSNFQGILEIKIKSLKREVSQTWSRQKKVEKKLAYLDELHIKFYNTIGPVEINTIQKWMKNESDVLLLLEGSIISDDDKTYEVRSIFYFGDLKEYLSSDSVTLKLPILSSEFANAKDSHTLVLLYALAMDAKRQKLAKNQIALFIKTAKNIIEDIRRRQGSLSPDLEKIDDAIKKATDDLLK